MITIGDFAGLGLVSVRMLRHYHEHGLLVPADVDPTSGRRAYTLAQLADLQQILRYRDLGFGVAEIRELIEAPPEQVPSRLQDRLVEVRAEISDLQHRAGMLEAYLELTGTADLSAPRQPRRREVEPLRLAGFSREVPEDVEDFAAAVEGQFDELGQILDRAGASRLRPISRYQPVPGGTQVVTGYVSEHPVSGTDLIELAAAEVATIVHRGPMSQIGSTFRDLVAWALDQGYHEPEVVRGARRTVFYETDPNDETNWTVEVQWELPAAEPD